MAKIDDKISEVTSTINGLEGDIQTRINTLKGLLATLQGDVSQANEKQRSSDGKNTTTENEIKLHEANITGEKTSIATLQSSLQQLIPEYDSKTTTFSELENSITQLESKKESILAEITEKTTKQTSLESEKSEKQQAFSDLEGSIDKDLEKYTVALGNVKSSYDSMLDMNLIWDYMFEILETPEIEIMAIIAANRGVSLDEIKQKATSVSPVFVGRAISKLEADGKIVNNNETWDISPSLLELINT